jgi:hypothetical protein
MSELPDSQVSPDTGGEEFHPVKGAALTITIQSWATPIVGLVMLAVGLLGGYYARPLLAPTPSSSSQTTEGTQVSSASQAELMEVVIAQTRHFKGDSDAPVTIIEFSDFL